MNDLVFLLGTLAFWIGVILLLAAGRLGVKAALGIPGEKGLRPLLAQGVVGAALIGASLLLPRDLGRQVSGPGLPLVWVYMAWPGWLAFFGLLTAAWQVVKGFTSVRADEQRKGWMAALGWVAASAGGVFLMFQWGWRPWVYRGELPLTPGLAGGFLCLAVVAVGAMAAAHRFARVRGAAGAWAATAALLAGCVVFGAPLVWQLIASVKEAKDQTTRNGFIWVPKVHQTAPYMDPQNPLFLARKDGMEVQAKLDTRLGDGKVLLEIERPYSMRGQRFETEEKTVKVIPRQAFLYRAQHGHEEVTALVAEDLEGGRKHMMVLKPERRKGEMFYAQTEAMTPIREVGLRWQNYTEALEWLPPETHYGLVYLNNTVILVILNVFGTLLSSALVGYGFARLRFPGRDFLFGLMLSTMMLPGAVTMMPQFLIFSWLGWIDTLHPLWAPSLFAGAFNVFLVRQFFSTVPMELEEAARIDGCGRMRTFGQVMLPQVQPALAAIGVWTFMGTWNNFMGPLIYISSPEKMPLVYALAMYRSERGGDIGMLMAFSTMALLPILILFFVAQRFFIEGVQLSGLGGR